MGLGFSGQGIINRARLYSCLVFILVFLYIFYFGAEPLFLGLEAPSPKISLPSSAAAKCKKSLVIIKNDNNIKYFIVSHSNEEEEEEDVTYATD